VWYCWTTYPYSMHAEILARYARHKNFELVTI
jgi:hypothetical protein